MPSDVALSNRREVWLFHVESLYSSNQHLLDTCWFIRFLPDFISSHERLRYLHYTPRIIHKSTVPPTTIPGATIVPSSHPPRTALHTRHLQPKLPHQPMNRSPSTKQRHHHGKESLQRVPLRIIPQLPQHPLQLVQQIRDVALPRGALIVRATASTPTPSTATAAKSRRRGWTSSARRTVGRSSRGCCCCCACFSRCAWVSSRAWSRGGTASVCGCGRRRGRIVSGRRRGPFAGFVCLNGWGVTTLWVRLVFALFVRILDARCVNGCLKSSQCSWGVFASRGCM